MVERLDSGIKEARGTEESAVEGSRFSIQSYTIEIVMLLRRASRVPSQALTGLLT